ncbi:septal ring lytic transglycosylase RlpA family protein [Candidatus Nucleicultrix amoebiphila]|jgi:rare lipoprotein A|uniref:septal ring lytic transglycosylase RlpA family protein n=1 Tax=Candidatus Nucleicultrix amoebiphila TaxID=1509244 RepID=UPI000A270D03|nr:septal ring lytic transglycosylase RlpA family protein [Candidatus Nucleicultrix amoebiphila]
MMLYPELIKKLWTVTLPVVVVFLLQGCSGMSEMPTSAYNSLNTPTHPKFAKRAYNKPYEIKGETYEPQGFYEYSETGLASYYGGRDVFHGRKTSMGETFDKDGLTAAHKILPIPCIVRVTNVENGRSIKVKINDRGPFVKGRIIDVSEKTAKLLGFYSKGVAQVKVDVCLNDTIQLVNAMPDPSKKTVLAKNDRKKQPKPRVLAQNTKSRPQQAPLKGNKKIMLAKAEPKQGGMQKASKTIKGGKGKNIFVQAGGYKQLASAKGAVQRLKGLYPDVPLKVQQSKASSASKAAQFRILVGPVDSNEQAQLIVQKLNGLGNQSRIVTINQG